MFLSPFARGMNAAAGGGDRSVFSNFWFEPLGMGTASGVRVTAGSAMRLSAVYSCVRVLSESFAVLPFRLYRRRDDGGRDQVTDHWLVRLMRRPNQYQTGFEWREMMMGHLCLRGNAFNEMAFGPAGSVVALTPLHPDRVKVIPLQNGSYIYDVLQLDGSRKTLPREAVWHIRGLSSDGIVGLNPMEMAAEVLGMGLAAQSFGSRFFANDARPAGWIEYDGRFADTTAKTEFRDSWQKAQGGGNRGKTAVLEKGFKYHELPINNTDAQFLELVKHTRSEIAGMFRVPPSKIGDHDRSTFSNVEQMAADFINDGLQPWAERWESSIFASLLLEEDENLLIDFDFGNLLRGDMAARSAYYNSNINNGSMTRNEARIAEGRNPLPGLDEPLQPLNMVTAGAQPAPAPMTPPPKIAPAPAKKKKAEVGGDRLTAIAIAAAQRVARKETAMLAALVKATPMDVAQIASAMDAHAEFVSAALGVDQEVAQAYVVARRDDVIRAGHEEEDIHAAALEKLTTLALKGTL